LSEDEKADLEEQIEERSLERNLLTPFTVLHVPKPALQEAMKSNLNGDNIDFDSIIFGRHRRNIEERLQYQGSIQSIQSKLNNLKFFIIFLFLPFFQI